MPIISSTFHMREILFKNVVLLNLKIFGRLVCWYGKVLMMINEIDFNKLQMMSQDVVRIL